MKRFVHGIAPSVETAAIEDHNWIKIESEPFLHTWSNCG